MTPEEYGRSYSVARRLIDEPCDKGERIPIVPGFSPQFHARILSDAFTAMRFECHDRWAEFGVW